MSPRLELVKRVTDLLASKSNVAIHAAPGAGKSWTADAVGTELTNRGHSPTRIDLSTRNSGTEIMQDIRSRVGDTPKRSPTQAGIDIYRAWGELSQALVQRPHPVTLVLDEFDSVIHYEDALPFLRLVREIIHRPRATNCNALIVSRRPLESIESQVRGISTLASVCYSEYLGSIDVADLDDCGWVGVSELTRDGKVECIRWAAGHAHLVQYWLATRPDIRPSGACETERILTMERLVDYLDTLSLLHPAAQLVLGPVVDDWLRERKQLEALAIISAPAASCGCSLAEHSIFRDALRRRTWDLNPWGILGKAEMRLRGLIEQVMLDAYGPEWAEVIGRANPQVKRSKDAAVELQRQDEMKFGRPGTWLAYTYPQDLWTVIRAHWEWFQSIFTPGDKAYWRQRFDGLATFRTPMAHNRVESLSESHRIQCRIWSEEILRCIDRYEPDRLRKAGSVDD